MRYPRMLGLALALAPSVSAAQTVWSYDPSAAWSNRPLVGVPVGYGTRTQTLPLGPGLSVERVLGCRQRVATAFTQCTLLGWRPVGFAFGARPDLERAYTFSGDGHGRVIASTERDVVWSDDLGRTWTRASWNGVNRPQVIALDPSTRFGVAVAEGAIHTTDDAGASWQFVRELPSCRLVRAVVSGRNAVLADAGSGVWALTQGNELQVVSEPGNGTAFFAAAPDFRVDGDAIVASDASGRTARVTAGGSVERGSFSGGTFWGH